MFLPSCSSIVCGRMHCMPSRLDTLLSGGNEFLHFRWAAWSVQAHPVLQRPRRQQINTAKFLRPVSSTAAALVQEICSYTVRSVFYWSLVCW